MRILQQKKIPLYFMPNIKFFNKLVKIKTENEEVNISFQLLFWNKNQTNSSKMSHTASEINTELSKIANKSDLSQEVWANIFKK